MRTTTVKPEFSISHEREDAVQIDGTIYYDEYAVHPLNTNGVVFRGTYAQCLIYVGARSFNHAHVTAVNLARGIYR